MLQEFSVLVSVKLIRMDIKNRNIIDEDVDLYISIESKKQLQKIDDLTPIRHLNTRSKITQFVNLSNW